MALQWKPVKGGPFAKLSFMRYGSHACTSLLPALHTCCHCDTLAERSLCSPGDQFKPWQHHTKPGCHLFRGTPRNPSPHLSGGPPRHFVSVCMCECEWVGKEEWERRLIKIWMWMGVEEEGLRGQRVCMQVERVNVWQENTVIMLIFLFLFCFQDVGRILSFTFLFPSARLSSATYAAHFYATARVVRGTEIWESGQLWTVACW